MLILSIEFRFINTFTPYTTPKKIFTGNTNKEKCITWGLAAATIPRCVKLQHVKGIANILAESVSRHKAVGLYHDLDF